MLYNVFGDTMDKEIELGDISKFKEDYLSDLENIKTEENIRVNGIESACFNKALEEKQKYRFNIQIPETKMYDQKNGYECNIYAF